MIKFDNIKRPPQTEQKGESEFENNIRPKRVNDYVGQEKFKRQLEVFINAAKKRQEPIDHILLHGPPGLGKTTLAKIVANELSSNIKECSGASLTRVADLASIMTSLRKFDVLFIDEIHRLPAAIEETLYACMEDYRVDIVIGEGISAKNVNLPLEPFTLIGATTRAGMLSKPLRDRFGIIGGLDFYSDSELRVILQRTAGLFALEMKDEVASEIASRSRGTPRIANRLLRRIRDFADVAGKSVLDMRLVQTALAELDVDASGLDTLDRNYLRMLSEIFAGGPVGIDNLATALNEDRGTIEDMIEPFLIQKGFIKRTPRGRVLVRRDGFDFGDIDV